ncbi:ankyrin repeat-containing domain protein, partial [Podospora aff. communis PSN243]
ACREGNYAWAKSLLAEGVDVNRLDAKYRPPIFYAVCYSRLNIVKLLIDHDALLGGADGQSSAMVLLAVFKDSIQVLRLVMEQSPPVSSECWDPRDSNNRTTPLSLAIEIGRLEAVKLLLDHGADVHESTRTKKMSPLCLAVDKGKLEIVRLLLDYHASIDDGSPMMHGLTPLHIAAYRGHDAILDVLLAHGADVTATCRNGDTTGVTALHLAANSECVDKLVECGAKVHAINSKHQHPLSSAVQHRAVGSIRTLLQHGSPVNAQDCKRETALEIA